MNHAVHAAQTASTSTPSQPEKVKATRQQTNNKKPSSADAGSLIMRIEPNQPTAVAISARVNQPRELPAATTPTPAAPGAWINSAATVRNRIVFKMTAMPTCNLTRKFANLKALPFTDDCHCRRAPSHGSE